MMYGSRQILSLIILLCIMTQWSCKKDGTTQTPPQIDTTSHTIRWQTETLGEAGSILNDIAIINDTFAYAVGEMYLRDSTGQIDPIPYNIAKWNGVSWIQMRIQFYTICGQSNQTPYPASAVFAFSATDVWISSRGGQLARWNGNTQTATVCMPDPFAVDKIWGENSNSIYAVGHGGRISRFASGTWQRIESGTTLNINDIWGAINAQNGAQTILCIASNGDPNLGSKVLQISGSTVTSLNTGGLSWDVNGIWFVPEQCYYIVGAGVHKKELLSDNQWYRFPSGTATSFSSSGVRGNTPNDVFVVGSFGEVVHFNGLTWHNYFPSSSKVLGRVAVTQHLVIAVGFDGPNALVLRGTR